MEKVIKSYFFGVCRNLRAKYVIDDNSISMYQILGDEKSLSLPPTNQRVSKTLFQRLFGLTDLHVYVTSGELVIKKIRNVNSLIPLLYGDFNRNSDSEQSTRQQSAWHNGLTIDDLEDFAVVVPLFPEKFTGIFWESKFEFFSRRSWVVKEFPKASEYAKLHRDGLTGKRHKKGEQMGRIDDFPIIAPCDGVFVGTWHSFIEDEYTNFVIDNNLGENKHDSMKFVSMFFRPRKRLMRDFTHKDFRPSLPITLLKIINGQREFPFGEGNQERRRVIAEEELNKFEHDRLLQIPISEFPTIEPWCIQKAYDAGVDPNCATDTHAD